MSVGPCVCLFFYLMLRAEWRPAFYDYPNVHSQKLVIGGDGVSAVSRCEMIYLGEAFLMFRMGSLTLFWVERIT